MSETLFHYYSYIYGKDWYIFDIEFESCVARTWMNIWCSYHVEENGLHCVGKKYDRVTAFHDKSKSFLVLLSQNDRDLSMVKPQHLSLFATNGWFESISYCCCVQNCVNKTSQTLCLCNAHLFRRSSEWFQYPCFTPCSYYTETNIFWSSFWG